ncbi:MAG TPA: nicotinate phosphoribosyltransferase [Chlamydiales bacterium]|nr:nicotinate phosphoribosyltransferase [Chlamydiales bacterium]
MTLLAQNLALLTDLYQLTMIYGYWKAGIHERKAVFHLNFRKWPFKGGFAIAAGLETAIEFLQNLQFSKTDLEYLASLHDIKGTPLFEKEFLHFLSAFRFRCDFDAVAEGSLVFPFEPIIRVVGPIWQAQLLESPMLNLINFQTLIATKAARICMAANPDPVIEFGMRRAQGPDGAVSATRAAYIGGCIATSNVLGGKLFGIPVKGTHAHSWVMAFDKEEESFQTFVDFMPNGCVILIDTYDSIRGVKRAIEAARKLKAKGIDLYGVRLDSGDLAHLSIEIRKILDKEGYQETKIMASNELDEYLILDLKRQGAKITVWGVGTNLVTGKEQPALDGVYKLSAIQDIHGTWLPKIKLSEQMIKSTNPGMLQIRRFFDGKYYLADCIFDELTDIDLPLQIIDLFDPNHVKNFPKGTCSEDLLIPVFRSGELVYHTPSLQEIQNTAKRELSRLSPNMERFVNPQPYLAGLEKGLYQKKLKMIQELKNP